MPDTPSIDDQIKAVEWAISLLHSESERARILAAAADSLREYGLLKRAGARVDDTRVSQAFERARMPV